MRTSKNQETVMINDIMEQFKPVGVIEDIKFIGGLLLNIAAAAALLYAVVAAVMFVMGQPSLVMLAGGVVKTILTGCVSLSNFILR